MTTTTSPATVQLHLGRAVRDALVAAELGVATDPPTDPILYQGPPPDDCCPPQGGAPRLLVWWDEMGRADRTAGDCASPVAVQVGVRYLCCWPAPRDGLIGNPAELVALYNDPTIALGRVGWVGYNALTAATGICDSDGRGKLGQRQAISPTLGFADVTVSKAKPRKPMGGCTGIDWTVTFTPTGVDVAHWMEPLVTDAGP